MDYSVHVRASRSRATCNELCGALVARGLKSPCRRREHMCRPKAGMAARQKLARSLMSLRRCSMAVAAPSMHGNDSHLHQQEAREDACRDDARRGRSEGVREEFRHGHANHIPRCECEHDAVDDAGQIVQAEGCDQQPADRGSHRLRHACHQGAYSGPHERPAGLVLRQGHGHALRDVVHSDGNGHEEGTGAAAKERGKALREVVHGHRHERHQRGCLEFGSRHWAELLRRLADGALRVNAILPLSRRWAAVVSVRAEAPRGKHLDPRRDQGAREEAAHHA
mmetsp:Transcript_40902/g.113714  ORF Transcript_40902/g.113714 Transcript_40902/m.113714 type:complete len:281 (-) Transcript_40902:420-1262(-)